MEKVLYFIFGVALLIKSAECDDKTPVYAYEYEAEMQVGTHYPASFRSQYKLQGLLHLKGLEDDSDYLYIKFESLNISLFNGNWNEKQHHEETKYFKFENDTDSFYKMFAIKKYENKEDGSEILFGESDILWSKNIKRGVGSFLRFDYESLKQPPQVITSYSKEEGSVYGRCYMNYSIEPHGSQFIITKIQDNRKCSQSVINSYEFYKPIYSAKTEPDVSSSIKKYIVNKIDGRCHVVSATSEGLLETSTLRMENGNKFFVIMKQQIKFHSTVTSGATNIFDAMNKIKKHSLAFQKPIYDIVEDKNTKLFYTEKLIDDVYPGALEMLIDVTRYLKENSFKSDDFNVHKVKVIHRTLSSLRRFNSLNLLYIFEKLKEDLELRTTLLVLLPYVGTEASAYGIVMLYKDEKISKNTYMDMLMKMPIHFISPSEQFIRSFADLHQIAEGFQTEEGFLSREDEVQGPFLLALGILWNRAILEKNLPPKSLHNLQIKSIADQITLDHQHDAEILQMRAIYSLMNIKTEDVIEFLNSTVIRNTTLSHHVRLAALSAPLGFNSYNKKEVVYNIYMPLLINKTESLAIRASAMNILIEAQMTDADWSCMLTVHWYMSVEPSKHLYNYYYTYIRQLSRSMNPHRSSMQKVTQKLLQITRVPSHSSWASSVFSYDSFSKKYTSGREIILKLIAEPVRNVPNIIRIESNSITGRGTYNDFSLQITLEGFIEGISEHLLSGVEDLVLMENTNLDEIMKKIKTILPQNLYVEIVLQQHGYTVNRFSSDEITFRLVWSGTKADKIGYTYDIKDEIHNKNIQYLFLEEKLLVTDIGVPAVILNQHPYCVLNIRKATSGSSKLNSTSSLWSPEEVALSVYNPFANSWHSVLYAKSINVQLPVQAVFNNLNSTFFKPMYNDGFIGLKNHAGFYTLIDIFDRNSSTTIAREVEIENSIYPAKVIEYDLHPLDYKLKTSYHGCQFNSATKHFQNSPVVYLPILEQLLKYPITDSCYLELVAVPSTVDSQVSLNLSGRINYTDLYPLPGFEGQVNGILSFTGRSKEQSLSYEFDSEFRRSANSVESSVSTKIKHFVGGVSDGNDIIVEFEKKFPQIGADAFSYGWGNESVITEIHISCVTRKCLELNFEILGEISDEQKQLAKSDIYPYSQCKEDQKKIEWKGPLLPRTWACFEGAIKLFYTRKITLNIKYENVPFYFRSTVTCITNYLTKYFDDYLDISDNKYTPEGLIQLKILHSAREPKLNLSLTTPHSSYSYRNVPGIDRDIYQIQLDNTHFSKQIQFLLSTALVRSCTANSVSVLTPDNVTVAHQFSNEYDLLTVTYHMKYAVFAKKTSSGMAAKIVVGNSVLELTSDGATLDGSKIENLENGFEFPLGDFRFTFRIWLNQGQITVFSHRVLFYLIYSPVSITLDQPIIFAGYVKGLCGDLDISTDRN